MKLWLKIAALVASAVLFSNRASAVIAISPAQQKIESVLGLKVNEMKPSPVSGLLEVYTDKGLFYVSEDGTYFLQARIFNLEQNMRNESEVALRQLRLSGIGQFADDAIEFKARNERYVVYVYTDISCGYCRQFHNQINEYTKQGITVRYLAFPRMGLDSAIADKMESVWCAADPQTALTRAKNDQSVAPASCTNNMAEQFDFAMRIGVTGTPNIILPDGSLIGGYQPPKELLKSLQ